MRQPGHSALKLLHYWWPLALGWSLVLVVARATGREPDPHGLAALLCGITAAYSLDRIADPADPARHDGWVRRLLAAAAAVSAICCGLAAAALDLRTAAIVPALAAAAVLYPRLKRVPLTKTLALPLIWIWAIIALPFNDGSWFGWHAMTLPVAVPLVLLVGAGCLLCDLKDEQRDRSAGVRSLPAMVGGAATLRVAMALAVGAGCVGLIEHRTGIVVGATALSLATAAPAWLASDAAGPLLIDMILTLPGVLIAARLV